VGPVTRRLFDAFLEGIEEAAGLGAEGAPSP